MAENSTKRHEHQPAGSGVTKIVDRACFASAAIAGTIILAVAATVTLSVLMRHIGIGGIRGDFELVEIGCGIAAFLFLPLCQRKGNHVMVDIFTAALRQRTRNILDRIWEVIFGVVWIIIAWQLADGLMDMLAYRDHSMLLRIPTWIIYAFAIFGLGLSGLVALVNTLEKLSVFASSPAKTESLK
ncbi:hypothetical protein TH25_16885 [Thalassospira profundimaris]|uniref:TRAP transporter small permease protein n=1 Tax=Thalassospira profundimaris TaxID=502049 RepID=A0A367WYK7_9PROT|nr:TRAP transporter small permease [Thalassospira profundimaris]RCK46526.1 hypothetical protein TH25_16885 [Thalassospira profundimaris]